MSKRLNLILMLGLTVVFVVSCSGSAPNENAALDSAGSNDNASLDKASYPVFPDADAGADPAVPAEQGGKGFTGEGWETNTDFDLIGDPRAVKGGVFRQAITDYPATLRYLGPNLSVWNAMLSSLVYETLIELHPTNLKYYPVLATHWQVLPDQLTYRFRVDPNARFNDGTPVTSEDVIASWKLTVDDSVQDPFKTAMYEKYEQPVAESKYIVRIKAKNVGWSAMYELSDLPIYPAHIIKNLDGATYIRDYNDKMLPGTGPYFVTSADLDKGNRVSIKRRNDYWAEKYRRNVGLYNFDEIREIVVRDENLQFEMVKKGDLDYLPISRAQRWVEELNFEEIQRGLVQKRKIFNQEPGSIQGVAMNTRRAPYDDVRVRKALRHLYNRESMIEKLMFNEYLLQDTNYPGSVYENPNNEKIRYDPQKALQLLAEAGWKDRDASGRLVKNGAPLTLEILYYSQGFERYYTIFQEDLRKLGITLNLRFVTPETAFKLLDEQQFQMFGVGYGGGGPFPQPEQFWHSKQADLKASTNVTGYKNRRVDELIELYDKELDVQKRVEILREIDGITMASHNYILEWSAPFVRVVYWNKFRMPNGIITRIGDYRDPAIWGMWWIDAQKAQQLEQARRDPSIKLEVGATEDRYWLDYASKNP